VSVNPRYWDSDCFLGWLLAEPDKEEKCRVVLQAAEERKLVIVSSALTVAEVLAIRGRPRIGDDKRALIEGFFRNEYILIRNLTRRVAELARGMVWDHGISPKDAIHVATALDAKLSLFNTFDQDICKHSGRLGSPILIIEPPQIAEPPLPFEKGQA
jgi:predicted nucleic acid-binding protein